MSGDVIVDDETFLQFELAMACIPNRECYSTFCSDIYITMNFFVYLMFDMFYCEILISTDGTLIKV